MSKSHETLFSILHPCIVDGELMTTNRALAHLAGLHESDVCRGLKALSDAGMLHCAREGNRITLSLSPIIKAEPGQIRQARILF